MSIYDYNRNVPYSGSSHYLHRKYVEGFFAGRRREDWTTATCPFAGKEKDWFEAGWTDGLTAPALDAA